MHRNQTFEMSFQVRLLRFFNFFSLFLFSLLFLFSAVIDLLMGLLAVKNFKESIIDMGKFYHGVAMCNGRKFVPIFSLNFLCISQAPLG